MFRLFRRKKKETPEKKIEEKEKEEISNEIKPSEIITEETVDPIKKIYPEQETPFEEKFRQYAKILPESLLKEEDTLKTQQTMLPIVERLVDQNDSIFSFISPQIITRHSSKPLSDSESIYLVQKELPPVSLEERIEGALFAVGRPIHMSEVIDNFDEDSPTIKRATRRLSRKKKRNSALIIHEISKDRWVLQLNPIFHEFFQSLEPDLFLSSSERRVLTEIAYRQPISLALVKKMVTGIGPIKITEICQKLEENGFVLSEKRSRSLIYTSTPKFARAFGFDNESRRLKLQMLWRLKRLMGDFEEEEPEEEEDLSIEEGEEKETEIIQEGSSSPTPDEEISIDFEGDNQVLEEEETASIISTTVSTGEMEEVKSEVEAPEEFEDLSIETKRDEKESEIIQEDSSSTILDEEIGVDFEEDTQAIEEDADSIITTPLPIDRIDESESEAEKPQEFEDLSVEDKMEEKESEITQEGSSSTALGEETSGDFEEEVDSIITTHVPIDEVEEDESDLKGDKLELDPSEITDTEFQPSDINDYDKIKINEESLNIRETLGSISLSDDLNKDKAVKEIKFGNHIEIIEEE